LMELLEWNLIYFLKNGLNALTHQ